MIFIYYLMKTSLVIAYLSTLVWMFQYNLVPLLEIYGGWAWLGTNLFMSFCGFVTVMAFFCLRKPRSPQATTRRPTC